MSTVNNSSNESISVPLNTHPRLFLAQESMLGKEAGVHSALGTRMAFWPSWETYPLADLPLAGSLREPAEMRFSLMGMAWEFGALHCLLRLRAQCWSSLSPACPVSLGRAEPWGYFHLIGKIRDLPPARLSSRCGILK